MSDDALTISADLTHAIIERYRREEEKAASRAKQLRELARIAGPGPEAYAWSKQAEFCDQVADAYRRAIAGQQGYLKDITGSLEDRGYVARKEA